MPKIRFTRDEAIRDADGSRTFYKSGKIYEMSSRSVSRWVMRGAGDQVRDNAKAVLPRRVDNMGNVLFDPEAIEAAEAEERAKAEAQAKAAAEEKARAEAAAKKKAEEEAAAKAAEEKEREELARRAREATAAPANHRGRRT